MRQGWAKNETHLNFEELELLLQLPVLGVELLDGEVGVQIGARVRPGSENRVLRNFLLKKKRLFNKRSLTENTN